MATITRYWRIGANAGGDGTVNANSSGDGTHAYQTLAALEAAEQTDLDTAGDILHGITTVGGVDTAFADFSEWITGPANYIFIECQGDARHNGVSREKTGTGYQLKRDGTTLRFREDYCRVKGFEGIATDIASAFITVGQTNAASSDIRVDECLFGTTDATSQGTFIVDIVHDATLTMKNTLILAKEHRGIDFRNATVVLDHVGVSITRNEGITVDDSGTVTNTWGVGATAENFTTGGTAPSGSHNASSDASAAVDYTDTVINIIQADEFTAPSADPALADYTLKDSRLNAAGTGSEAVDITGAARTGTADIGPFDFLAAAPSAAIMNQLQYSNLGSDLYNGTLL